MMAARFTRLLDLIVLKSTAHLDQITGAYQEQIMTTQERLSALEQESVIASKERVSAIQAFQDITADAQHVQTTAAETVSAKH